ncbi:hypothetical protein [Streptomyces cellostaticus]|nr:hypothetical protein [Streptomyces cellostaticus]
MLGDVPQQVELLLGQLAVREVRGDAAGVPPGLRVRQPGTA